MICCDRCEEWFHGDCVGITEARGRLMERNGEDYICPNCTTKKNQLVRPATSILSPNTAVGKHRAGPPAGSSVGSASAEKANSLEDSAQSSVGAPLSAAGIEDVGIKGRIEKATNPTGKKKIKIFQPVGWNWSGGFWVTCYCLSCFHGFVWVVFMVLGHLKSLNPGNVSWHKS